MFVSTAFIIFSATLGAVLISFDGVSRDRLSGVLEVKLSNQSIVQFLQSLCCSDTGVQSSYL